MGCFWIKDIWDLIFLTKTTTTITTATTTTLMGFDTIEIDLVCILLILCPNMWTDLVYGHIRLCHSGHFVKTVHYGLTQNGHKYVHHGCLCLFEELGIICGIIVTIPTTTQHNHNTVVGLDVKMTVPTTSPFPTHHRNSTVVFRSLRLTFIDHN